MTTIASIAPRCHVTEVCVAEPDRAGSSFGELLDQAVGSAPPPGERRAASVGASSDRPAGGSRQAESVSSDVRREATEVQPAATETVPAAATETVPAAAAELANEGDDEPSPDLTPTDAEHVEPGVAAALQAEAAMLVPARPVVSDPVTAAIPVGVDASHPPTTSSAGDGRTSADSSTSLTVTAATIGPTPITEPPPTEAGAGSSAVADTIAVGEIAQPEVAADPTRPVELPVGGDAAGGTAERPHPGPRQLDVVAVRVAGGSTSEQATATQLGTAEPAPGAVPPPHPTLRLPKPPAQASTHDQPPVAGAERVAMTSGATDPPPTPLGPGPAAAAGVPADRGAMARLGLAVDHGIVRARQAAALIEVQRAERLTTLGLDLTTDALGSIRIEATRHAAGLHLSLGAELPATRALLADHADLLQQELANGRSPNVWVDIDGGRGDTATPKPARQPISETETDPTRDRRSNGRRPTTLATGALDVLI